jgi:hypothetical protein
MILHPWERGLFGLTIALTAAVLLKLGFSGLVRVYRLLFCFLAADCIINTTGLTIRYDTAWYGYFYFASQTLKIVIAAFVLVEIYWLALEKTPALAQFGRNSVGAILAAAALVPFLISLSEPSAADNPFLRGFLLFEQSMDAAMAIFLIVISLFMAWFPVRLKRNVILYICGFIVWSLSRFAQLHLVNQALADKRLNQVVTSIQLCIVLGCLLLWLVGLEREGESRTAVVGHLWNRAEAEHYTRQLAAINNSLERLRRRSYP